MRGRRSAGWATVAAAALLLAGCFHLERASVSTDGVEGNGPSMGASLSHDGRFVAFESTADNLVPGDTNGVSDIFVRDHQTHTTTLVSVSAAGGVADGSSTSASISGDGRYVAFDSTARNLVDGDVDARSDVFVRDLQTGTTTRLSPDHVDDFFGLPSPVPLASVRPRISGDGRYVTFREDTVGGGIPVPLSILVIVERETGTATEIEGGTFDLPFIANPSAPGAISEDGSTVLYTMFSSARGFTFVSIKRWVRGAPTTVITDATYPLSTEMKGMSDDGSLVTFTSDADLVPEPDTCVQPAPVVPTPLPPECDNDLFVWQASDGSIEQVPKGAPGLPAARHVDAAFVGDSSTVLRSVDGAKEVLWTRDLTGGAHTVVARVPTSGPVVSADGKLLAFSTDAALDEKDHNSVTDVYVRRAVAPVATSIEPDALRRGDTQTVTVKGEGFEPSNTIMASGQGVSFSSIELVDPTTLRAVVSVTGDAPLGVRDVWVSSAGRFPGSMVGEAISTCARCLHVGMP